MDLFSHLNWYKKGDMMEDGTPMRSIPSGKLVVVSDTLEADASFVIHHLIQASSKDVSSGVCLLALNQSLFHYNSVGRKLGYNLATENTKNKFTFINGMSASPYAWVDKLHMQYMEEEGIEEEPPIDSITKGFQPFTTVRLVNNQPTFSQFLQYIYTLFVQDHQRRLQSNPQSHTTFIIDNINLLNSFNNINNNNNSNHSNQDLEILYLIQYLHSYVKDNQNCSIIVLFHSDCNDDDTFFKLLQYESDLTMSINGLASGYSKDIDGQITFLQKNENDKTLDRIQPVHYQVLDNQIRFFSMGSRIQ